MLKMVKEDGPGGVPLVMLGLSFGNIERLRVGEPIRIDAEACALLGIPQREIVIFAGTNERAMAVELESHGLLAPGTAAKVAEEQKD